MVQERVKRMFSEFRSKLNAWAMRDDLIWRQFKLIVTDPPRYAGHFRLIKDELVPFVEKNSFHFWVTNYHDATFDFILFRIKSTEGQLKSVQNFLDNLKKRRLIADWEAAAWDPRSDAISRIDGLRQRIPNFDPTMNAIVGYDSANNSVSVTPNNNLLERQAQLTALFESVGECSRAIYSHLGNKPSDLWTISLFIHLLLNSLDFSGPDAPSEEHDIRSIPAW
jgi:hypothetical protein